MALKVNPTPALPVPTNPEMLTDWGQNLVQALMRELVLANVRSNLLLAGDGTEAASGPVKLASYTVAGVPAAATYTGSIIYVSNGTANKRLAVSDGTNWRWPDGAIVS